MKNLWRSRFAAALLFSSSAFVPGLQSSPADGQGSAPPGQVGVQVDLRGKIIRNESDFQAASTPVTLDHTFNYNYVFFGRFGGVGHFTGTLSFKSLVAALDPGDPGLIHGRAYHPNFAAPIELTRQTLDGESDFLLLSMDYTLNLALDGVVTAHFFNTHLEHRGKIHPNDGLKYLSGGVLVYDAELFRSDFDLNGFNDLALSNPNTGRVRFVSLGGGKGNLWRRELPSFKDETLAHDRRVCAIGDIDRDGDPDLIAVADGTPTSTVFAYLLAGTKLAKAGIVQIGRSLPAGLLPVAAGDFNNDGAVDLLLFHETTGELSIDLLKEGGAFDSTVVLVPLPAGVRPIGTGDINQNKSNDLILFHEDTRQVSARLMSGTSAGATVTGPVLPEGATLVGVGAANGDLNADLLYLNERRDLFSLPMTGVSGGTIMTGEEVKVQVSKNPTRPGFSSEIPKGYDLVGPQ